MNLNTILFLLIPIAAISFSGLQVAEGLCLLIFIYEFIRINKLSLYIITLSFFSVFFILGDVSITALSQIVKASIIPLLALRVTNLKTNKINSNQNNFYMIFIVLCLVSVLINFQLPFGEYLSYKTGLFRHSVDLAAFVVFSVYFLVKYTNLPRIISLPLTIITAALSGSRTLMLLTPMVYFLMKPISGLVVFLILFSSVFIFWDFIIFFVPDKMVFVFELAKDFDFKKIIYDDSMRVRFKNFSSIFEQMSNSNWLFGMSRAEVLSIAGGASGDPATDNIFLYKMIFFGIPAGVILPILNLYFIQSLLKENSIFIVLLLYGMLQDWLSNGFIMFIIYVFCSLIASKNSQSPITK